MYLIKYIKYRLGYISIFFYLYCLDVLVLHRHLDACLDTETWIQALGRHPFDQPSEQIVQTTGRHLDMQWSVDVWTHLLYGHSADIQTPIWMSRHVFRYLACILIPIQTLGRWLDTCPDNWWTLWYPFRCTGMCLNSLWFFGQVQTPVICPDIALTHERCVDAFGQLPENWDIHLDI